MQTESTIAPVATMTSENSDSALDENKEWLRPVLDPEIGMSLVDLGLIYSVRVEAGKASVEMTLTSPGCPAGDQMVYEVKTRMLEKEGIQDAEVKIVWEPKWDPREMASEEAKERLNIW